MFAVTTIAALIAALTSLLPVRQATAASSTLVADSYTASTAPTANKGKATTLNVSGPPDATLVQNAYIRFDLSTLPAAATADDIAKATLTIYVTKVTGSGSFDVKRVASAWTESTINAGSPPTLGTAEQSAVPVAATDANQFKVVDVTAAVKAWRDGSLANNGLAMVANAVDGLNARFDSKESAKHS